MWQIMPATGRLYLRVNRNVDERLNVRAATLAAAQILRDNYEKLGTWPLAITAYNHGANGMRRAVDTVGTTDFGVIVQRYRGPLFGFASQNFYAEFLAALECRRTTSSTLVTCCLRSPPGQSRLRPVRWASRALLALLWSPPGQSPWKPVWWASCTRRLLLRRSSRRLSRRVWWSRPRV